jgi:hypothetical protein
MCFTFSLNAESEYCTRRCPWRTCAHAPPPSHRMPSCAPPPSPANRESSWHSPPQPTQSTRKQTSFQSKCELCALCEFFVFFFFFQVRPFASPFRSRSCLFRCQSWIDRRGRLSGRRAQQSANVSRRLVARASRWKRRKRATARHCAHLFAPRRKAQWRSPTNCVRGRSSPRLTTRHHHEPPRNGASRRPTLTCGAACRHRRNDCHAARTLFGETSRRGGKLTASLSNERERKAAASRQTCRRRQADLPSPSESDLRLRGVVGPNSRRFSQSKRGAARSKRRSPRSNLTWLVAVEARLVAVGQSDDACRHGRSGFGSVAAAESWFVITTQSSEFASASQACGLSSRPELAACHGRIVAVCHRRIKARLVIVESKSRLVAIELTRLVITIETTWLVATVETTWLVAVETTRLVASIESSSYRHRIDAAYRRRRTNDVAIVVTALESARLVDRSRIDDVACHRQIDSGTCQNRR